MSRPVPQSLRGRKHGKDVDEHQHQQRRNRIQIWSVNRSACQLDFICLSAVEVFDKMKLDLHSYLRALWYRRKLHSYQFHVEIVLLPAAQRQGHIASCSFFFLFPTDTCLTTRRTVCRPAEAQWDPSLPGLDCSSSTTAASWTPQETKVFSDLKNKSPE